MPGANGGRGRGRPRERDSVRSKLAEGEVKQVQAIVPTSRYKRLKTAGVVEDRTLNDVLNQAIEDWLEKHVSK